MRANVLFLYFLDFELRKVLGKGGYGKGEILYTLDLRKSIK